LSTSAIWVLLSSVWKKRCFACSFLSDMIRVVR
jgi:hypothetical protein